MPIKILVTGADGQLGSELRYLSENQKNLAENMEFYFADRALLDITSESAIEKLCQQHDINHIINCAAYTAVDKAESEPEQADLINHLAVQGIATVAKANNIAVIHISTDYVFDGKSHKPYTEKDTPNPQSVYGRTKLLGEQALQRINPSNSIIIRTAWVYSSFGSNFVKTMLKLGKERDTLNVVADQVGTPTYARDLAAAILQIIPQLGNKKVGLYHYSNEGVCSWYDFADAVFQIAGIDCKASPILGEDYPTPAVRPYYSVLNNTKISAHYGICSQHWRLNLMDFFQSV